MATDSLQRETAGLNAQAQRDLAAVWATVAAGNAAEDVLNDLLPSVVLVYGEAASAMAADWYMDRRAEAAVRSLFEPVPVLPSDRGAQALITWALRTATGDEALQTLVAGGVQRRIADHARYTIAGSAVRDPGARGWKRVGTGKNCSFCDLLIGRGAVYTELTADFRSHDHCDCSAVPVWR